MPLSKLVNVKKQLVIIIGTAVIASFMCLASYHIYQHAGVVRDVPELNVYKNNVHRGMHAEYCDRPYNWDKEFENDGRIKVLVLGNSFGRDWANVLYEWDEGKIINISYLYYNEKALNDHINRVEEADIIFYASGPGFDALPEYLNVYKDKLYVIGNKNYGQSNGIIYAHRFSENYFEQTVEINEELLSNNSTDEIRFGDRYISMMLPVMVDEIHARVFTDDHKFISQDCRHLTQAGAQYYARILNIDKLLHLEADTL